MSQMSQERRDVTTSAVRMGVATRRAEATSERTEKDREAPLGGGEVGMLDKVASGSGGAGGRNLSVPAPLEGWWGHLGEEFCGDDCELTAE